MPALTPAPMPTSRHRSGPERGRKNALRAPLAALALLLTAFPVQTGARAAPAEASPAVAGTQFLVSFEDLPLMPGLVEQSQAEILFDTPRGRLVQTWARGRVPSRLVYEFYHNSLPNLGWTADSLARFHRGGERLDIEMVEEGGTPPRTTVRFTLSPR